MTADDMRGDEAPSLPHDIRAEQAALGGMLLSQAAAEDVMEILGPADYFRPAHAAIHEAAAALIGTGAPADAVTVAEELTRRGELGRTGGPMGLHTLIATVPVAANAAYYARIVREKAVLRGLILAAKRIEQVAREGAADAADIIEQAEGFLAAAVPVRTDGTAADSPQLYAEAAERYENPPDLAGLVTVPWADLRSLVPYLRPGELITIGATPGSGKSVTAADLLRHAGLTLGLRSVLYTLEMTRGSVMDRIISAETNVPLAHFQQYAVDDFDWQRLAHSSEMFTTGRFTIDDSPSVSLASIRADLRRSGRDPFQIVIVDYLQLMRPGGTERSREREVAALAEGLKAITMEFRIPVVMLAQLNRNAATRPEKTPTKTDLRESGAIENSSDVVILIHRPDIYDPDSTRPGEADLIVAKNRSGAMGTRTVLFQGEYGRFVDLETRWTSTNCVNGEVA